MSFSNFKFGENAFQIRTTSRRFARWMNATLSAYRVRRKAPVAFSVVIAGGEEDRIRARKRFHVLYQGTQRIIRTKDIGTLARGLFAEIERALLPERDDALYLGTPAIAKEGKIALVPDFYRSTLARLGRRPELAGLRLPVERMVAVDDAGGVIPVTPRLEIPDDAVDRVTRMFGDGAASVPLIDRPVTPDVVVGYVPNSVPEDHMEPLSRGRALYCLTTDVMNMPKVGIERALNTLARLVEQARCYSYYSDVSTPQHRTRMLTGLAEVLKS
ncbi:MAG: hypothetical protein ACRDGU_07670 [Actinomycetota bacterium]